MKITLLPADTYTVINKTILTLEDRKNLICLYEPIIGPIAVSLYLTLWNDLDKLEISSRDLNHHHLMSIMKIDLNSLKVARESLESVGLIKTYYKEGEVNSYIYEIYSPMTPKEFLNHPIFNIVLYNNIGKVEYEAIKAIYQRVEFETSSYTDITKNINDTFKSSSVLPEFDVISKEYLKVNANEIIDFDELVSSLPKGILNEKSLNKRIKDLINNLAFVYDLDTLKMSEIIRSVLNVNGTINTTELRKFARNYYTHNNSNKLPTLIYRSQPEYLKTPIGDSSKRAKIIYVFENTTPYNFLKNKYKGVTPTSRDLKLLEDLMIDLNLKPAVVNVLIDYVLKINNNKLTRSFVETIAGQWVRKGIQTADEAMRFAEKESKKVIKSVPKSKTKEKVPVWFGANIEKEEVSQEEEEELKELMKGYN